MGVLAFIEKDGQKIIHVVEVIGHSAVCVEKLLVDGQKLAPAVKAALVKLVQDGEALATTVVAAGAVEGVNWVADAAAIAAVRAFVADFLIVLPVLKAEASIIAADIKTFHA